MVEFLSKTPSENSTTINMMNFIEGSISHSLKIIDLICEKNPDTLTHLINQLMKVASNHWR